MKKTMSQKTLNINEYEIDIQFWIKDLLEGPGGLRDFEDHEIVVWPEGWTDRYVAAEWIVRCLGNPRCEGSREIVLRLMARHGIAAGEEVSP
jgi:hypothetical protein